MTDIDKDYEHIRKQLYDLSEQGDEAIELMLELARESEHPRAFEVLGQLIKQNAEIAEKLMKLQKTKKEVENEDAKNLIPYDDIRSGSSGVTNNAVFIGSTAELQKMLRDEVIIDADVEEGQ
jgi:hypothetical protein